MYPHDRDGMRRFFLDAWSKACARKPLEPLEARIAELIRAHPEYHALLGDPEVAITRDFSPEAGEVNPFFHISLHLAILEQVETDQPPGVRRIYRRLLAAEGDPHEADHRIMECLAQFMWEVQHDGQPMDLGRYKRCIKRLLRR